MEEIRGSINSLRRRNVESRYYIPEAALYKVLDETSVRIALQQCAPHKYEDLVKTISKGGRKILSILLLNSHEKYIEQFVAEDQYQTSQLDHRLPFELEKLHQLLQPIQAELFYEKQWEFTSPVFSESVLRRQLSDQTILPFTSESSAGKGSFGIVYKIQLDSDQNDYSQTFPEVSRTKVSFSSKFQIR
jgi:hypothetical protein